MQREACDTGRRARGFAKKIDEGPLFRQSVLIGQDADNSCIVQRFQDCARRFILVDWLIAGEGTVAIDESVESSVIQRPRHVVHGITVNRVCKGRKLPSPDVTGKDEHALAAPLRLQEIFVAFDFDDLVNTLSVVASKARELHGLTTEIPSHILNGGLPTPVWPIRKREV